MTFQNVIQIPEFVNWYQSYLVPTKNPASFETGFKNYYRRLKSPVIIFSSPFRPFRLAFRRRLALEILSP
jgi:hypothetical protein